MEKARVLERKAFITNKINMINAFIYVFKLQQRRKVPEIKRT